MTRPTLVVTSVTVATPTPRESAAFYARLLGVEVAASESPRPEEPPDAGWAQVKTGTLTLNFEYERHWTPIVWPAETGHLWLIPMGWLARESGWMPSLLGWILMIGGIGYVANAFLAYVLPNAGSALDLLTAPATIGELWMVANLCTRGVRRH